MPAIVHMTHNSEELGNGLADVLFGDINPGGRLVHKWPKSIDQLLDTMDYDIRHGRVTLAPGGKKTVEITVDGDEFTSCNVDHHRLGEGPGPVKSMVGSSSMLIRFSRVVTITE